MKLLGVIEVHRLRRHPVSGHREMPWDDLFRDLSPSARLAVARVARSEVKNYLAELAEQAEIPFGEPVQFLQKLNDGELTCEDLGHDPRIHSPSGRDAIAREQHSPERET